MTHIAMVPQTRLFDKEHLTLCWLGRTVNQTQIDSARQLVSLVNNACRLWRDRLDDEGDDRTEGIFAHVHLQAGPGPYRLFSGGQVVACCTVSHELQQFHDVAEIVGLNATDFHPWTPHITGMQAPGKNHWRKPGEFVRFSHAELRNIPEQLMTNKEREASNR